jgi:FAD/FMN-containing dehydrogenase/Fe-S oxidoreductase
MSFKESLTSLSKEFTGEIQSDSMTRAIYATDASVYRAMPSAVTFPKSKADILSLIHFAKEHKTTLIPRTAGTSLAGQCVGDGIVVDVSKHFTKILELNEEERWVRVQAGVIRDELNQYLVPFGLFFGPETSTSNRAMMGGMVGNNSTGSNSIMFGNTRDHIISIECFLSNGELVVFKDLTEIELQDKIAGIGLEAGLYRHLQARLQEKDVRREIINEFPKASIKRRNTGYAVDELLNTNLTLKDGPALNLSKLIAGSEGTLAFITEIKLNLLPLPPKESVVLCPHFNSVNEALLAVQKIMPVAPFACELMDKLIMDCTKEHAEYKKYRFFLKGDPAAVLMIELRAENQVLLQAEIQKAMKLLVETEMYDCSEVFHPESANIWKLRKAGLGLLANIPGDKKAVAVIEDTAVHIDDLSNYIKEFTAVMAKHGQKAVYYAHAGAGEIHLRPILDLKQSDDVALFKEIAWDTARLVKKYKGSLSGEHGDGRVRASFIPFMLGEKNYKLLQEIKHTWDPNQIFNAGKITDAPPIDQDLRYEVNQDIAPLPTLLSFSAEGGMLRLAEKCNGSGDCRKTHLSGGTMCPSYMATKNEKDTTRARANVLREFLTKNDSQRSKWSAPEIKEALDLCLSCKACKSECPSNVDMAAMKAEFTYQYNKIYGVPFRSMLFGHVEKLNRLASLSPGLANWFNSLSVTKKVMGLAQERTAPKLAPQTLVRWFQKRNYETADVDKKKVLLFADEFTNYYDVEIGKKCVLLLEALNYEVKIAPISDSGRAFLSKGLLVEAKNLAIKNVAALAPLVSSDLPIVGIEPSAILSFRDEYIRLLDQEDYKDSAIVKYSFTIDEFLASAIDKGQIDSGLFHEDHVQLKLHGHCHQKAISELSFTQKILSLPKNHHVELIPSGCCGMAGSFGFEKEHYETSMQVGELVLFPVVRKAGASDLIVAAGTSCRHQIFDGTQRKSLHPLEVLYNALESKA